MLAASFASSSRLKPEIRLAQAVSEFEAALSGEQKAEFRTCRSQAQKSAPDISDVMRLTAEIDRSASRKGRRCFGPRLTNVLQAVQQFASIGDIIIGGSQNLIACGVWSLVRMAFLTISQSGSYLEKLSMLFMAVGRSAPRYQAMALLFSRSKKLQRYLYEYFIAVVRLCQETMNHSKKSAFAQLSSNFVDSELKKIQSELELWANSIKEEVTLLSIHTTEEEAKESSMFRGLILKYVDSDSYRRNMEARIQFLDACSTYDYATSWKQARKKGSATWFTSNITYQTWKNRLDTCSLYLTGKLGSGKTIIMASIIDDLNLFASKGTVLYFFCRHDIAESLKPRTIIGCLARQLLQQSGDFDNMDELIREIRPVYDSDDLIRMIHRTLSMSTKAYYFVLDGVDECAENEKEEIFRLLKRLQEKSDLLFCVSFRDTVPETMKQVEVFPPIFTGKYAPLRTLPIPAENPDIRDFIDAELEARLESGKLSVGNPAIILEIRDALESGAKGMWVLNTCCKRLSDEVRFLWVALQIDSICDEKTDCAIRSALKDLPRDLPEIFRRILQKSGQTNGTQYQQRILRHITAAYHPLTVEELREALSVKVSITIWDTANLVNNINATLACCGSLITIDEEELTVRFAHHSIVQFLTGHICDSPEYQFTLDAAKTEMSRIIVTYLNYGVFDTQVSRTVVPRIPAKETPSRIVDSVLGQASGAKQLALALLKSRGQAGFDIGKILSDAKNSHRQTATNFCLLPYAKEYWYTIWSLWRAMLDGSQVVLSMEEIAYVYQQVETFAYYPIYLRGKFRFRRLIRIVILTERINQSGIIQNIRRKTLRSKLMFVDDRKGTEERRFDEIVRAVLMEIEAAKELETYGKALKMVEMIMRILPYQNKS